MLVWVFLKLKGFFMKVFKATASGNQVMINGKPVQGCPILGEALGESSGYLVISGEELVYLPKTTPDMKTLLEILKLTLGIIATGVLPQNLGGKITTDTFATEITEQQMKIEELMGVLK